MPYKHLWIFSNHHQVRYFWGSLYSKMVYQDPHSRNSRARNRLTFNASDGQHEITVLTIHDIEHHMLRGQHFDKVSIHETVELNWELHHAIQMATIRSLRGMGFDRIIIDEMVPDNSIWMVNENFILPSSSGVEREDLYSLHNPLLRGRQGHQSTFVSENRMKMSEYAAELLRTAIISPEDVKEILGF